MQARLRTIRELRKWDLAPAGAIFLVVALAAIVFYLLYRGGPPSLESRVRAYFRSPPAGSAPKEFVERMKVWECADTGQTFGAADRVYRCPVSIGSYRYEPCFAWNVNGHLVVAGRKLAGGGCEAVRYVRTLRKLIVTLS